jgi:hypothetical protein
MTQISLKLFNKSPFARSDSRSLSRAGRAARRCRADRWCLLSMRMYTGISDDLSKAEPIALGPRPPASLPFLPCRS